MKKYALEKLGFKIKGDTVLHDEEGHLIYKKHKNGLEQWWIYDEKGRQVEYKTSQGMMIKTVYKGDLLFSVDKKTRYNQEYEEYNEHGDVVYSKETIDDRFFEHTHEYDERKNLIRTIQKDEKGNIEETVSEYDERNREIKRASSNGDWWIRTYDENNQITSIEDHKGEKRFWKYDERGNEIEYSSFGGRRDFWVKSEYDEDNILLYQYDSDGEQRWFAEEGEITIEDGQFVLTTEDDERIILEKV